MAPLSSNFALGYQRDVSVAIPLQDSEVGRQERQKLPYGQLFARLFWVG